MTRLALAVAVLSSVAACGGGGSSAGAFVPVATTHATADAVAGTSTVTDSGTGSGPVSTQFSGTAAAGLPVTGTVTVKDAQGRTKTAPLVDGNYQVDVTGFTGPFVFRAEGVVGGEKVVIHSAATAADANGTINITPFTDLIVANIAGQVAASYFDSGAFSSMTAQQLASETAGLKAKLLPVLLALGVDGSIDLLRSAFAPITSPLDKALDVLRVSVDPATNVATITNIVTQQQIQDDLATKAAAETALAPLTGEGMTTASDDIAAVRKLLADFTGNFANGSPAPASILALLTDGANPVTGTYGFRDSDATAAQFAAGIASDPNLVGASFTDVVFRKIDYTITPSNTSPRAFIEFTHKDRNGVFFSREQNMQAVKGTDGVWRLRGNGRVLDISTHVQAVKDATTGCVYSALQFMIEDPTPGNSANVATVVVTGPGLPAAGLRHVRPAAGGTWNIEGKDSNIRMLASNCSNLATDQPLTDAQIAAIPDSADYTLTALDSGGAVAQFGGFPITYKERTTGRPLTLAEATAASFPTIGTSTPLAGYAGGDMTLVATGLDPLFLGTLRLSITDALRNESSDQVDKAPTADGRASASLSLAVQPGPFFMRAASATRGDAYWREFTTRQSVF